MDHSPRAAATIGTRVGLTGLTLSNSVCYEWTTQLGGRSSSRNRRARIPRFRIQDAADVQHTATCDIRMARRIPPRELIDSTAIFRP